MSKFKKDQTVFIFDPKRKSVYECTISGIIKKKNGEEFLLTPSSPLLPELKLPQQYIFQTFVEAYLAYLS